MMRKIHMVDLYTQYLTYKGDIDKAIKQVIRSTAFIGGEFVMRLENEIANYCQTKYAVSVNSGTDALYLALRALGVSAGDEVITSPFSFFATAEVIAHLGAKPVFADIDEYTFTIDPSKIEEKISRKTKAIIPVHLFGMPAKMTEIRKLANKYKLFLLEDACQAIGAVYNGKKAGGLSDIGCFSFFPSKNLGAFGDGGIITTNKKRLAEKIIMLRNHGSLVKYRNKQIGVCSRLDGLQASILSAKLKHLNTWNKRRLKIARTYSKLLSDVPWLETPQENKNSVHVFNQYTLKVKNGKRDALRKYLTNKGISTMIYYPIPLHLLPALKYLGYKKGSFPLAETASKNVLSLPIYPEIREDMLLYITDCIKKYV